VYLEPVEHGLTPEIRAQRSLTPLELIPLTPNAMVFLVGQCEVLLHYVKLAIGFRIEGNVKSHIIALRYKSSAFLAARGLHCWHIQAVKTWKIVLKNPSTALILPN
jgi:hypothetical protein